MWGVAPNPEAVIAGLLQPEMAPHTFGWLAMERYAATYSDAHGSETTTISNDGMSLRMVVRGVEFVGRSFDLFEPAESLAEDQLRQFSFYDRWLSACRIECRIPIPISNHGSAAQGTLLVELVLREPLPNHFCDDSLRLTLEYDNQQFAGSGTSGWFEDELLEIQKRLPDGVFMKACINCLYSDYSPYGHQVYGDMSCFRNLKAEYLKVSTKMNYLHSPCRGGGAGLPVQETYLCPEFERRIPGTGYRG